MALSAEAAGRGEEADPVDGGPLGEEGGDGAQVKDYEEEGMRGELKDSIGPSIDRVEKRE